MMDRQARSVCGGALGFALLCAVALLTGCVMSTYGKPGTEPVVAQPPVQASPPNPYEGEPMEVQARHILLSFQGAKGAEAQVARQKDEAHTLAEELRARALGGEDFEALARENSDDPGSASQGGSLGTFRREQMVPEFSDAAFALEPGGISEVVESPFGFHVIQRTQ